MVKQSAQPPAAMQILLFQGISVLLKLQDFCFPGFFPTEADALVQRTDIRKGTGGGIQPSGGAFPISGQGFSSRTLRIRFSSFPAASRRR